LKKTGETLGGESSPKRKGVIRTDKVRPIPAKSEKDVPKRKKTPWEAGKNPQKELANPKKC